MTAERRRERVKTPSRGASAPGIARSQRVRPEMAGPMKGSATKQSNPAQNGP
jgi:hypothetical protein